MYSATILLVWAIFLVATQQQAEGASHGAQVRVTNSGLKYLSGLEARLIEREIPKLPIPQFSGSHGPIKFSARNTRIRSMRIGGGTSISILPNVGLQFNVQVQSAEASTTVSINYHAGWIRVGDTTNVNVKLSGVDYSIGLRMTASNGKPHVEATSCRANIRGLNLHFSGGLGWLYNLLKGILIPRIKGVFQDQICKASKGLVNNQGNQALAMFPTRLPIANLVYIDYSFKQAKFTGAFMDWLLQGEFLDKQQPKHSALQPPSFDTGSQSSKMAYIWYIHI